MADKNAKISSIESIEQFHQNILTFTEESLSLLDSVKCEVQRYLHIIESEIPARIRRDISKWEHYQKEAKQEMNASRTSSGRIASEQKYRQASTQLRKAQDQLEKIKKNIQQLPALLPTPRSTLVKSKTFLVNDMSKAVHLLKHYLNILDDYKQTGK
jgi:hypothetical protein